jgi:hypothetical protein
VARVDRDGSDLNSMSSRRYGARRYLARIGDRPAYRRAMQKGDAGMALLLR